MLYNYKSYPHSKAATRLSAFGKGIMVTGISSVVTLILTTILPELFDTGSCDSMLLITYALLIVFFIVVGVILLAIAKRVALKAEEKNSDKYESTADYDSQDNLPPIQNVPQGDLQPQGFEDELQAQKYIKKRLLTNKKGLVVLFVMVVLFAICLSFGLFAKDSPKEAAIKFNSAADSDNYYYSDILWISNWLYKYDYDVYYIAQDTSAQTFVIKMTDEDFEKLSAQYEYFLSTDENEVAPKPYRVYGIQTDTTDDLEKNICEATGVTQGEFSEKFGNCYFDATTTPQKENSYLWLFAAFMLGLLIFPLGIGWYTRLRNLNQSLKVLKENGQLIFAATELSSFSEAHLGKKKTAIVSENFLFSCTTCMVISLSDILLCYKKSSGTGEFFCVYTKEWKDRPVASVSRGSGLFEKWLEQIRRVNPEVLVGKNGENLLRYNQKKDI